MNGEGLARVCATERLKPRNTGIPDSALGLRGSGITQAEDLGRPEPPQHFVPILFRTRTQEDKEATG